MNENERAIERVIELIKDGELLIAKEYLLGYCDPDESLYAFMSGMVIGRLSIIDKQLARSFVDLYEDEMSKWF
jgi:hypothetical protein